MIDHKQLLRLVDEAHAVLTPVQIAEMSISMDVTEVNLKAILDEATAEWEAIKDAAAEPSLPLTPINSATALERLNALRRKHDDYGAMDTEGREAIGIVEDAVLDGKHFPLHGRNPFQLYSSRPGWETASTELVAAAHIYFRALVQERYGVTA